MADSLNKVLRAVQEEFPHARQPPSSSYSGHIPASTSPTSQSSINTTTYTSSTGQPSHSIIAESSSSVSASTASPPPPSPKEPKENRQTSPKPSFITLPKMASFATTTPRELKAENVLLTPGGDDLPFVFKKKQQQQQQQNQALVA